MDPDDRLPVEPAALTRVLRWDDPVALRRAAAALDGIELLRGQIDGAYPPVPASQLLNLSVQRAALGRVQLRYRPDPSHGDEGGHVHGGLVAALLEATLRHAVASSLPAGLTLRTVELNVHLVNALPLNAAGSLLDGTVVHGGRRLITAEARLRDGCGVLYAHGSTTLAVQPRGDAPPQDSE